MDALIHALNHVWSSILAVTTEPPAVLGFTWCEIQEMTAISKLLDEVDAEFSLASEKASENASVTPHPITRALDMSTAIINLTSHTNDCILPSTKRKLERVARKPFKTSVFFTMTFIRSPNSPSLPPSILRVASSPASLPSNIGLPGRKYDTQQPTPKTSRIRFSSDIRLSDDLERRSRINHELLVV